MFKSELNPLNVPFVSDTSAMADGNCNYMTPQLMSPHQTQQLQQQQSTFQTLQPLAPFPQVAAAAGNVLMMNQAMGYFFSCPITLAQPPQNTFATYPPAHPSAATEGCNGIGMTSTLSSSSNTSELRSILERYQQQQAASLQQQHLQLAALQQTQQSQQQQHALMTQQEQQQVMTSLELANDSPMHASVADGTTEVVLKQENVT